MTASLDIPKSGLSLRTGDQSGNDAAKPTQIMRLNLAQSTLDELIQSLRNDEPARIRLGKHPTLHYAGKSQSFHAYPETHRSEIYRSSSDNHTIYFTGVLSHSLEVEKAKQDTAATDQALATLEESLNAFERGKESKKTHIIQHPDELRALRASGATSSHRGPRSKSELDKDRLLRTAGNRSLTSSPTLGAPKSPASVWTPTSAPSFQNKNNSRLEALKTPFIHLLAVRAVSTKFLARQTRSSVEDCAALAQKYGSENRLNREKFDLKDKTYKDLDVWKFPYPTQEDRQQAIENAISAFDRMRISRTDKLWQSLLPKEERGKGKCLSRLNLSTGPIKKAATPRIQVDDADGRAKEGDAVGSETDRAPAHPVSSRASDAGTPRLGATSQRSKDPAKRTAKGKSPNNSTLSGRVTKKTERKAPSKAESKIKSAEFVHDSDEEDDDMPDVAPSSPASSQPPKEEKPAPPKKTEARKTTQAPAKARVQDASLAQPTKVPKAEPPAPRLDAVQSSKTSSKRPPARQSTSPQKPSPLGSSPPANASDARQRGRSDSQNQSSSSSSSSPLISQLARNNQASATTVTQATALRPSKPAGQTNGVTKAVPVTNSLKRKAEPDRSAASHTQTVRTTGNLDHKRRRAVSTSSGGSTGSASPPMSQELLRQQLWAKSKKFKQYYAKYRSLHASLAAQKDPPRADLDRLQSQHKRLERMKSEIWEEDRRLRNGILS